jgi:hypothetical protein
MRPTSIIRDILQLAAISFALSLLASPAFANPDVYAALPSGIRVLQYGLGDVDGDSRKELAVLYTSEGAGQLALFKADAGRWVKWSDGSNSIKREDGAMARSMEITDTNGDGTDEILAYYLSDGNGAMFTRVLAINTNGKGSPELRNILEDRTVPPGYPLLGSEGQKPSVTFLQMGNGSTDGLRRVYCWNGDSFEKCVEVIWEKP